MKKIILIGLVATLGLFIGKINAEVELEEQAGRKRFFKAAVNVLPCDDYRIEIIATNINTDEKYVLSIDTYPYQTKGSTITFHTPVHGNVR